NGGSSWGSSILFRTMLSIWLSITSTRPARNRLLRPVRGGGSAGRGGARPLGPGRCRPRGGAGLAGRTRAPGLRRREGGRARGGDAGSGGAAREKRPVQLNRGEVLQAVFTGRAG